MSKPVIVVLGAGEVGTAAASYVCRAFPHARLVVADLDREQAVEAAGRALGDAMGIGLDVTDAPALRDVLKGAAAVLNCVGPFYRFGVPVLEAAIAERALYLDICDDWDATLALRALDSRARDGGSTAVVGQGASPGNSNLLAMLAVSRVTDCHTLLTGWSLDDTGEGADSAAGEHLLHQVTGTIKVWESGRYQDERPLRETVVRYPGLPERSAITVGHPEAVTLPQTVPNLRTCRNLMTLSPGLAETVRKAAAAVERDGVSCRAAARDIVAQYRAVPHAPQAAEYPGVWAIAVGGTHTAGAHLCDYGDMTTMGAMTAAPLVAGLTLILSKQSLSAGVFAPEEILEPHDFFRTLAQLVGAGPMVATTVDINPKGQAMARA